MCLGGGCVIGWVGARYVGDGVLLFAWSRCRILASPSMSELPSSYTTLHLGARKGLAGTLPVMIPSMGSPCPSVLVRTAPM